MRTSLGMLIGAMALTTVHPGAPYSTTGACATGGGTTVQADVGSVAWAFRRLKMPCCREMSARGYALHIACAPNFLFFPFYQNCGFETLQNNIRQTQHDCSFDFQYCDPEMRSKIKIRMIIAPSLSNLWIWNFIRRFKTDVCTMWEMTAAFVRRYYFSKVCIKLPFSHFPSARATHQRDQWNLS